jgi:hypothetical protein
MAADRIGVECQVAIGLAAENEFPTRNLEGLSAKRPRDDGEVGFHLKTLRGEFRRNLDTSPANGAKQQATPPDRSLLKGALGSRIAFELKLAPQVVGFSSSAHPLRDQQPAFSRRRIASKAARFRARACAAAPRLSGASTAFPALLPCRLFTRLGHATWGGQNKENSVTIFELAFVLNSMARLIAALATLITTIHRRPRS